MNSLLQFDFIVNKEKKTINIHREFAADLDLVWAAWTEADILDQWWAPKPYRNKTKNILLYPIYTFIYFPSMFLPQILFLQ